jgi:hypothetical protein
MAAPRQRPVAVTLVAMLALVYGIVLTVDGAIVLFGADGEDGEVFAGVYDVVLAVVAFLIAYGAFRIRRWAWALFMSWAVFGLTLNLLRQFAYDDPRYLPLVLGTLAVFLLTPLDIQVAFGVRSPPHVQLDSASRNPVERV